MVEDYNRNETNCRYTHGIGDAQFCKYLTAVRVDPTTLAPCLLRCFVQRVQKVKSIHRLYRSEQTFYLAYNYSSPNPSEQVDLLAPVGSFQFCRQHRVIGDKRILG